MRDKVLVVQKSSFQKKVWERILETQGVSLIIESPEANLQKILKQASASENTSPDIVLLEMSIEKLNPYDFCRWTQENYPSLKVILTAQERVKVSDIEQRWARSQGAYELVAGFDRSSLDSGIIKAMALIMSALKKTEWDHEALVSLIEEMTEEFGEKEEPKTLIQEPETVIQKPSSEQETSQGTEHQLEPAPEKHHRTFKLKPKVKRFRGLPY